MALIDDLKKHEGFRSKPYRCSEDVLTIGWGFAIKDLVLDEDVAEIILKRKLKELQKKIASKFDWFDDSPQEVKDVVTNMVYQLGLSGFSLFKQTIYYLETEQYEEAADEMLDSLWAKQTPNRAKVLSDIIRNINGHTQQST